MKAASSGEFKVKGRPVAVDQATPKSDHVVAAPAPAPASEDGASAAGGEASAAAEAVVPAIMPRQRLLLLMCGTCVLSIMTSKIHTAIHVFSGALILLITFLALMKLERSSLMTIRKSTKKEV